MAWAVFPFEQIHDAVKVQMGIEQGVKAVDEGDGADAGVRTGARIALAHTLLHRGEEDSL
jgi:hypothetical protein